jgi:geranylgeranyl reductase family protein
LPATIPSLNAVPDSPATDAAIARRTTEVLVVGAGPAGVAAAASLVRAGRQVLLVDKAVFPRDKCCGDGLTTLALRELEALGFDPATSGRWFDADGAWIRSPSGREVHVPLPDDGRYAAIVPRIDLDHALVRLAIEAGVEMIEGVGVTGPLINADDFVEVGLEDGTRVRARYLVAADGMWSPIRKMTGTGEAGYLGDWHAVRQYARHVTGPAASRLYVWFEPDLLPGYAWSFPLPDGRVNLGFGVLRERSGPTGSMKALWAELLERPHIRVALGDEVELEDRHLAWPIPARIDRITLDAGRVLFVGDAAAATDVLTGEGIGQALMTGRLAAEAIIAAGALDAATASAHYRAAVRHHLVADHQMSALLGRVLRSERGARAAIRVIDHSGRWGKERFARWMFEDEPRAIIATPSRWHRRFLARPGAWAQT